jgi:hypothetical protein
VGGEDAPAARLPDEMARTPDALQTLRHRLRRLQLDDQVHRPDVDAQLQRRGADQRRQRPGLERLLQRQPRLLGDAAVVGADRVGLRPPPCTEHADALGDAACVEAGAAGCVLRGARGEGRGARRVGFFPTPNLQISQSLILAPPLAPRPSLLVDPIRRAFRQPPVVDEDQGGAVLVDEIDDARHDQRPDRVAGEGAEIVDHGLDLEIEGFAITGVDDGDGARDEGARLALALPRGAAQIARHLVQRADRGGQPDALDRLAGQLLQSFQAQRQVHAALRAGQGVDLVDDHRLHRAEHLPRVGAGEQDVERFGRGDQDVRRLAQHGLAVARGRVAGTHRHADIGQFLAQLTRRLAHPRQRHAQVAFDVVVEGLERGNIDEGGARGEGRGAT